MHRDSVGAEDGDSYGFNYGGKDCYMPRDSVGAVTATGTASGQRRR